MRGHRVSQSDTVPAGDRRRSAAKRAKMLDDATVREIAFHVSEGQHGARNLVIFYLSHFCGLRAQEIAYLQWDQNVLDAKGKINKTLFVGGDIGKYGRERSLEIPSALRLALTTLRDMRPRDRYVVYRLDNLNDRRAVADQRPLLPNSIVKFFERLYEAHGLEGCSSHSGRRGFITKSARTLMKTGKHSVVDVKEMAGHADLNTTMAYIDPNPDRAGVMESMFDAMTARPRRGKVVA